MAIETFDDIKIKEVERMTSRRLTKEGDGIVEYDENGKANGTWYQFKDGKLVSLNTCKDGQSDGLQIIFDEHEKPQFVAYADHVAFKDYKSSVHYSKVGSETYPDFAAQAHQELDDLKRKDSLNGKEYTDEDSLMMLEDTPKEKEQTYYIESEESNVDDPLMMLEERPIEAEHTDLKRHLREQQEVPEKLSVEVIDALTERIR